MRIEVERIITLLDKLDITGITLLSVKEADALPLDIRGIGKPWWLRSPGGDDDYVAVVYGDGYVYINGHCVHDAYGVRPALIVNLESSGLEIGDKFKLAEQTWTIISDEYALCDDIIDVRAFRYEDKAFDANDFEKSDVKKFLKSWARENGIVQKEREKVGTQMCRL